MGTALRLTAHAQERCKMRGITEQEVRAIVAAPSSTYIGKDGKLNVLGTAQSGRTIRVV